MSSSSKTSRAHGRVSLIGLAALTFACGQPKSAAPAPEASQASTPPTSTAGGPGDAIAEDVPADAAGTAREAASLVVEYDEGCPSYQCGEDAPEVEIVAPVRATVTSQLAGDAYLPQHLFDQDRRTAWCEGVEGPGVGQRIKYELAQPVPVAVLYFTPFYAKDKPTLLGNGRIKQLRVTMEGGVTGTVELVDQDPSAAFAPGAQLDFIGPYVNLLTQGDRAPVVTRWVEFEILEVYAGARFDDTCISEISLMTARP